MKINFNCETAGSNSMYISILMNTVKLSMNIMVSMWEALSALVDWMHVHYFQSSRFGSRSPSTHSPPSLPPPPTFHPTPPHTHAHVRMHVHISSDTNYCWTGGRPVLDYVWLQHLISLMVFLTFLHVDGLMIFGSYKATAASMISGGFSICPLSLLSSGCP